MARDVDLYNIGDTNEELQRHLIELRRDFDSHNHDGTISRAFQNLYVESIASLASLSVRKTSFNDNTAGFWVGIHNNIAKLFLGSATNSLKWDGTTLTITGTITATTGTIGGWTIGTNSLVGGTITLSTVSVSAAAGTIKVDGGNTRILVGSGIVISGVSTGTITVGSGITIDGASTGTITGGIIRTAASGARVEINGTSNALLFYGASTLDGQIAASSSGIGFFDGSSNLYAVLTATGFGLSQGNIVIPSAKAYLWDDTGTVFIDKSSSTVIRISGGDLNIASAGKRLKVEGVSQPIAQHGYVNSNGTAGTPFPSGWSVALTATGRYTVTHNLGTTNYVVLAIAADAAAVKYCTIESRSTNSFIVRIANVTPALEDNAFMFVLFQT